MIRDRPLREQVYLLAAIAIALSAGISHAFTAIEPQAQISTVGALVVIAAFIVGVIAAGDRAATKASDDGAGVGIALVGLALATLAIVGVEWVLGGVVQAGEVVIMGLIEAGILYILAYVALAALKRAAADVEVLVDA